ncbi:MAG: DUF4097 domain-containing protein [Lachnospiraceae bacterium]|nr:DUF4097 domain-containing protein [Lachnospiraceae bacterium]
MKNKYIIGITVVTVLCVIIGTMYHVVGLGWSDGDSRTERIEVREADGGQTVDSAGSWRLDPFDSIKIDADILELWIGEGDGGYIEYECTKGLDPTCEVKDGVLYVRQNAKKTWTLFGVNNNNAELRVTVPRGTDLGTIDIEIDVGNIELDGLKATRCDIEASVGNIEISACTFDACGFDSDTGNVVVEDAALGNASCSSAVGNVELRDCTFGNLKIEADIGDTRVRAAQTLADYDIDLELDLGDVTVNGRREGTRYSAKGTGGYRMEISSDMGNISVDYEE